MLDDLFRRLSESLDHFEDLDDEAQEQLREAEEYLRQGEFEEAADILADLAETVRETGRVPAAGEIYMLVTDCYRRADEGEDANEYGVEAIDCFLAAQLFDRAEEALPGVLRGLRETGEAEEALRLRRRVERIIGDASM